MTTRNIQHRIMGRLRSHGSRQPRSTTLATTLRIYRPRFIPTEDGPKFSVCEHWWMIDQRCYWCGATKALDALTETLSPAEVSGGKNRYRGNITKG